MLFSEAGRWIIRYRTRNSRPCGRQTSTGFRTDIRIIFHHDSLATLPRGKKILLPDHYSSEIADSLRGEGFDVTILQYRVWFPLSHGIRVMCIDNLNQDGILLIEAGDGLLVNLNDSPLCGETGFIRNIVRHSTSARRPI